MGWACGGVGWDGMFEGPTAGGAGGVQHPYSCVLVISAHTPAHIRSSIPPSSSKAPPLCTQVKEAALELGYQPDPTFCLKVSQLREIFEVRWSVFLLGPAGCGKSAIWRTLMRAQNNFGEKTVGGLWGWQGGGAGGAGGRMGLCWQFRTEGAALPLPLLPLLLGSQRIISWLALPAVSALPCPALPAGVPPHQPQGRHPQRALRLPAPPGALPGGTAVQQYHPWGPN